MAVCPMAVASDWTVEPSLRLSTGYDGNVRLETEDPISSGIGTLELELPLYAKTERTTSELGARARFVRYEEDSLDANEYFLRGAVDSALTERASGGVSLDFIRDSTLTSEFDTTGVVDVNKRREADVLAAKFSFDASQRDDLGATAALSEVHYVDAADTGLRDYRYLNGALHWNRDLSERWSLGLQLNGGGVVDSDAGSRDRSLGLQAVARHALSESTRLSLAAGQARVRLASGAEGSTTVWSAGADHNGERWRWSFGAAQEIAPTGRGVLSRQRSFSSAASRGLTERLYVGINAEGGETEYERNTFSGYRYGRASLWLSWRASEYWRVESALAYKEASNDTSDSNATGSELSLALSWGGRQFGLPVWSRGTRP